MRPLRNTSCPSFTITRMDRRARHTLRQSNSAHVRKDKICPYQALCPMSDDNDPLTGYKESNAWSSWVPISDDSNDWVNLSSDNACTQYTPQSAEKPEWGRTSKGSEEITRNIVCCKGSIWGSAEVSFMHKVATEIYTDMVQQERRLDGGNI